MNVFGLIDELSFDDLKRACSSPRSDHPSRKSMDFGQPGLLPKCYGGLRDGDGNDLARHRRTYGEFIPNPPGCVGLRKIPRGLEAEVVERMKTASDKVGV
jgi:hypothetical protein